jgi:hypothetical protein
MQGSARRALLVLALCAAASLFALRSNGAAGGFSGGDGKPEITAKVRAATLRFAPAVRPGDRAWILNAIATARPEAQQLIAEVDGLVEVRTDLSGSDAIGLAQGGPEGLSINFDSAMLNGERAIDRNVVVLHELGHIVDFVLADDKLVHELDAGIPDAGQCTSPGQDYGPCTAIEERFADTFAKWALRGRFSLAGSGYAIPTPPSLEDWGMPLGRLAAEVEIRARTR